MPEPPLVAEDDSDSLARYLLSFTWPGRDAVEAQALVAHGLPIWRAVLAVDRDADSAAETVRLIESEGGVASAFGADVTRAGDCEAMVEACLRLRGRVDVLLNNVGIGGPGGPVELGEEDWDRTLDTNLKAMFLTCKYVLPHMEQQGSGVIVNVSSLAAVRLSLIHI